jgi:hypothetical protein
MVTAELALALPALVLVLAGLTTVTGAMSALAKASDAARSGVRAASIGVGTDEVVADTARLAPRGSQIEVTADGAVDGWVAVTVTPPAVHLGPFRVALPPVTGRAPLETHVVATGR